MLDRLSRLFRPRPARPYHLLQIEPTLNCSLSCVMCPWTEVRASGGPMSWETFEHIQPYLSQAEEVDFTGGGEPLVNPRLPRMVQTAKIAGCRVGFSTSGIDLDCSLSEELIDTGIDWISFSIDAASPALYNRIRKGSRFEAVIRNIAALSDLKRTRQVNTPSLMMVFVMMAGDENSPNSAPDNAFQNFHELPAFVELAHSLGVESVIAKNLDVILKPEDDTRRLFRHAGQVSGAWIAALDEAGRRADALGVALRRYAVQPQERAVCEHNPLDSIFINWEGWVSPCITLSYAEERYFAGEVVHTPCQRFGNINQSSLETIWNHPEYAAFRASFEARRACDRRASVEAALGSTIEATLPHAPEGCQTCYYLYGI